MFDVPVPGVDSLKRLSDADLIDAAKEWARRENAACAAKLAVMAEIFIRRTQLPASDRETWWVDPDAAVAAELAAAQAITRSLALHQTHRGVVLRDRLPAVAALFARGLISEMLVSKIVSRTDLILEDSAMAAVDADLAAEIVAWGPRSMKKAELAIDALVERHDPGALRRARESSTTPDVEFGSPTDAPGFTTLWARLYETDAAVVERCLREMAHSVCSADPRSMGDRLAAAITARIAGIALACECGFEDCDAGALKDRPTKDMTVYVLTDATTESAGDAGAEQETVTGTGTDESADEVEDATSEPDTAAGRDETDSEDISAVRPAPADVAPQNLRPAAPGTLAGICAGGKSGFVFGSGIVPAPLLARLLTGARFREIRHPGQAGPEPGYTPSRALADFIRARDLTCRFPWCDDPATSADIDHTVPYPTGPTHPSNLKCLCRFHHLLKTFWIGALGWRDRQYPDGTVRWTSPTGHIYTTEPGSRLLFPVLCRPTATLWTGDPPVVPTSDLRGRSMPRRRRTRAHNRARAITAERRLNDDLVAERTKPPPF